MFERGLESTTAVFTEPTGKIRTTSPDSYSSKHMTHVLALDPPTLCLRKGNNAKTSLEDRRRVDAAPRSPSTLTGARLDRLG